MSEYDNSAILFKNFRKKLLKHPDYIGSAKVKGVAYNLSAWIKTGRKGKFLSVAFSIPQPRNDSGLPREDAPAPATEEPSHTPEQPATNPPECGDIPF